MQSRKFASYQEAKAYQLSEWVAGRPWHNPYDPLGGYGEDPTSGECCPDFSCCHPEALWDEAKREEFRDADVDKRQVMLFDGLRQLLEDNNFTVETSKQ